jgi:perosamine synthetase
VSNRLAIHGGEPHIVETFGKFKTIGPEERAAAVEVIDSGVLSGFIGAPGPNFLGGKYVKQFEELAADYFKSNYCVTFNSWTSGLIAAVGAIPGLEPGDEIITSPWTMSATAMAILHWQAIPVFVDISSEDYCLDVSKIREKISPRTKAILTVDIFGYPSNYTALRSICNEFNLLLIGDSAQAPNARHDGEYVSKLADIGGYSLNYHKHLQTGEGGFALTDSVELADRMHLIRNHAESVVGSKPDTKLMNMIGYNFRLGEIEAAMASPQLRRLQSTVESRVSIAQSIISKLESLRGLIFPSKDYQANSVFYMIPIQLDQSLPWSRAEIVGALKAEGVPALIEGYANIQKLPIFQSKIAYGSQANPWSLGSGINSTATHDCPIADKLYSETFLGIHMCTFDFDAGEVDKFVGAFFKVWEYMLENGSEREY